MKKTLAAVAASIGLLGNANALERIWEDTAWVGISNTTYAGQQAYTYYQYFGAKSYDGSSHSYLRDKYKPSFQEIELSYVTKLTETFAITHAWRSGQYSEKLSVDPSLKLGFIYLFGINEKAPKHFHDTGSYSYFTLSASHVFGGNLKERGCTDDFNRQYNCRTALAVTDSPLLDRKPFNQNTVFIKWTMEKDLF